jgi:putative ABC transport system permease protein
MLSQMIESAPPNMPNVFLINITSRDLDPIRAWLNGRGELVPTLGARLTAVNGRAPSQRRFEQARGVSYAATPRKLTEIVRGRWPKAAGEVCVFREPAQELGIDVGAKLEWEVGLQPLRATVTCLFKTEEGPMAGRTDFVFSPPTLAPFPVQYYGLLRMKPADIPAFQRDTFRQFRSITVINLADLVAIVQEVVDQIAIVVRFISAFAIAAGAIILASSIAATRFRRAREVAILKTLGATRSRVSTIFSMEFSILGAAAGTLGSLMATLFSNLLLVRFFEAKALFDWQTIGAAVLLTVLIANLAGWLASFRILGQKPLEVLRGD